jgi:integrase
MAGLIHDRRKLDHDLELTTNDTRWYLWGGPQNSGSGWYAVHSSHTDSPVGKRVYDLRHTCLTMWLNAGIPAPEVAEWAGNGVQDSHSTYARCIAGQTQVLQRRMLTAQKLPVRPAPARGRRR